MHAYIHTYFSTYCIHTLRYNSNIRLNDLQGISQSANAVGRTPRHLFILPGAVAEIHTSMPGRNVIVFNNRHGIIRLLVIHTIICTSLHHTHTYIHTFIYTHARMHVEKQSLIDYIHKHSFIHPFIHSYIHTYNTYTETEPN